MSTSKNTRGHLQAEIADVSTPADCWLDAENCALVIKMAGGVEIEVPLTAKQFEEKRDIQGVTVHGRKNDEGS